jgi:hypothetical protein
MNVLLIKEFRADRLLTELTIASINTGTWAAVLALTAIIVRFNPLCNLSSLLTLDERLMLHPARSVTQDPYSSFHPFTSIQSYATLTFASPYDSGGTEHSTL